MYSMRTNTAYHRHDRRPKNGKGWKSTIVSIVVAFVLLAVWKYFNVAEILVAKYRDYQLRTHQELISGTINAQLPRRINEYSMLMRVDMVRMRVSYHIVFETDKYVVTPDMIPSVERQMRTEVCAEPEARRAMSYGVKYWYSYRDHQGKYLGAAEVTEEDCSTPT